MADNPNEHDNPDNNDDQRFRPDGNQNIATRLIGVGASAGGLMSLEKFFAAMPADTGFAFVVIQHLAADSKSVMDTLLGRVTKIPVVVVDTKPVALLANHIYLVAPSKEALLSGSTITPHMRVDGNGLHLPINNFFHQMAKNWRENCVGIIMSGSGADGSSGIASIREVGGVVIAQSPETARFDGMPKRAIESRLVDVVLAPEEMPGMLVAWDQSDRGLKTESVEFVATLRKEIEAIFGLLLDKFGVDFRYYKPSTITRRIYRRIGLIHSVSNLSDYLAFVKTDESELKNLYFDLLIGVTRFYRDEKAFDALREIGIPRLFKLVDPGEELRVWVCGCSSGEEAYSIAIELLEAREALGLKNPIKVFATDLHSGSIQAASEGIFSREDLEAIPEKLRLSYFRPFNGNTYRPTPELRKTLIFSEHNLLKNPPFTRMHLVCCRNLMIYLNSEAQSAALVSLNFALVNGGVLFLGSSESTGRLYGDFEVLDRHWKLFTKVRDSNLRKHGLNIQDHGRLRATVAPRIREDRLQPINRIYNLLLDRLIPAGFLIGDSEELLHVFGSGHEFLRPPSGRVTGDIYPLLCDGLSLALSTAVRNIKEKPGRLSYRGIRVEGHAELVELIIESLYDKVSNSTFYIVLLNNQLKDGVRLVKPTNKPEDQEADDTVNVQQDDYDQEFSFSEETAAYVEQLQNELQKTRELLQSNAEELETSNEELQASNEELLASNEELQSTNEELHSVNEELYSVNAEHESKIVELDQISADLRNLVNANNLPIVLLDANGGVRIFTPLAAKMFNLVPQDVGRDIRHFRPSLKDDMLLDDLQELGKANSEIIRTVADSKEPDRFFERSCKLIRREHEDYDSVFLRYSDVSESVKSQCLIQALVKANEVGATSFAVISHGKLVLHRSRIVPNALRLLRVGDDANKLLTELNIDLNNKELFNTDDNQTDTPVVLCSNDANVTITCHTVCTEVACAWLLVFSG